MPTVQITFDCVDPHASAEWWAELLGYVVADGHELIEQMLRDGVVAATDVVRRNGRWVFATGAAADDPGHRGPRLYFQAVPEANSMKSRVHVDVPLAGADLDADVARLVAKGASFVGYGEQPGHRWAVMTDPEGTVFCLTPAAAE